MTASVVTCDCGARSDHGPFGLQRQLLAAVGHALIAVDIAGTVIYWNNAAQRLYGWSETEALGRSIGDLTAAEERAGSATEVVAQVRTGTSWGGDYLVRRRDGTTCRAIVTDSPILDPEGNVVGTIGASVDVSDRAEAAQALERSEALYRSLLAGCVAALSSTFELRDPYTTAHQRRVASIAWELGLRLGLAPDELEGLRVAALLHDIGKIAIPAEILSKPGPLTGTEFALVQQHSQLGHDIVGRVRFPWPVAETILQHHERLDGSGYPNGLAGDAILVEAQIVAVADVLDAVASHRPYRPALGLTKAAATLRDGAGTRFGADVVSACLDLLETAEVGFEGERSEFVTTPLPLGEAAPRQGATP